MKAVPLPAFICVETQNTASGGCGIRVVLISIEFAEKSNKYARNKYARLI